MTEDDMILMAVEECKDKGIPLNKAKFLMTMQEFDALMFALNGEEASIDQLRFFIAGYLGGLEDSYDVDEGN